MSGSRASARAADGVEDRLPRRFGQYQLFDRIGKGGMATIYLARMETGLGAERLVVVKEIHEALSKDPSFSTQFVDEAKLCAGLRHANIAQVVDLGRADGDRGVLFMAMEYVEGFDLQQLLRRLSQTKLPLQPEFAFHIVRETLTGLDFAHRATGADGRSLGIVHRDVSPSNVLISLEGEVKLCDFGIAKAYGRAGEMGLGGEEASTTESGHDATELGGARVVGKSAYMAPEHARGEPLDARADVFAAGILLWEMCAGRRLYKGSEAQMLELARRAEIPRLPSRGLPGHDELQALLDRALSPDREARFPTAKAMLDALDGYLAKHRLLPSQLRFAAFLTDHFGEELVAERRAREVNAREAAISQPPSAPEPAEPGRPRRFPMPDLDLDDAEAKTVLKPAPVYPAAASPALGAASAAPQASAPTRAAAPTPTSAAPTSATAAAAKPASPAPGPGPAPVNTAHLGMAAVALMLIAALLGAGLFYLLVR